MSGKRAPGGGRKPKGPIKGNREPLNLRVTPQLKQSLQREADRAGHSVSQEVQLRLETSLKSGRKQKQDDVARVRRALSTMIESCVVEPIEYMTGASWSRNRFTAEAIRVALDKLMMEIKGRLALDGPIKVPKTIKDRFLSHKQGKAVQEAADQLATPDGLADAIVAGFMDQFDGIRNLPPPRKGRQFSDTFYLVIQLRRDLGLM